MIQYICDGCEEIINVDPPLTVTLSPGMARHFHGFKCIASWGAGMADMLNSGWMGRPE